MSTPTNPQTDALNALVVTAMMQALDQEKRDELIRKALVTLVAPRKSADPYRNDKPLPSVIEEAFGNALEQLARELVREMVNHDQAIREQVQALCAKAVEKAFANSEEISTKMAAAFTAALLKDRY